MGPPTRATRTTRSRTTVILYFSLHPLLQNSPFTLYFRIQNSAFSLLSTLSIPHRWQTPTRSQTTPRRWRDRARQQQSPPVSPSVPSPASPPSRDRPSRDLDIPSPAPTPTAFPLVLGKFSLSGSQ